MTVFELAAMGRLAFEWIENLRAAGRDQMTPEELDEYEAVAKLRRKAAWARFEAAKPPE